MQQLYCFTFNATMPRMSSNSEKFLLLWKNGMLLIRTINNNNGGKKILGILFESAHSDLIQKRK